MKAKRFFDFLLALILSFPLMILIVVIWLITTLNLNENGFFFQQRIGQYGKKFTIIKFKTIHSKTRESSKWCLFLRNTKLDEIPQIFNILIGEMSFVGPRPDLPGYYDVLEGEDRKVLELKPGLTSLASLKYRNEEKILDMQENPKEYNDEVIFPDKVKMNLEYFYTRSFIFDIKIILKTLLLK